jgi:hypothetical protein
MKNKNKVSQIPVLWLVLLIALFALSTTACSKSSGGSSGSIGGGGKSLNSATELKEYLDKQPANSPDKPIKVAMKVNDMMIKDIVKVLDEAGKYVSLDLSGSPLTEIPYQAFAGCTPLAGIIIPNSVTSIEMEAFAYCANLASVTIPNSVTRIRSEAFEGTAWLDNQPDGVVYAGKVALKYKGTMPANTSINISDGTKGIANGAFAWCTSLTSVTIPNSVISIGGAFSGCTSLTSITIPNSVTSIESSFHDCTKLTSVMFQGTISSDNFEFFSFTIEHAITDLRDKYLAGGIGTYTRPNGGRTWTKQ